MKIVIVAVLCLFACGCSKPIEVESLTLGKTYHAEFDFELKGVTKLYGGGYNISGDFNNNYFCGLDISAIKIK
jgi:hypothetical protein